MADSLEIGILFLNSVDQHDEDSAACKKMDEAIEKSMLEFLKDDLPNVQKEDRNTGRLLSQDEKVGIERLIEALQLVPWPNMEHA